MNTTPPLLPETTFKPLSARKLDAMIDTALTHRQLPKQAQVIAFRSWGQQAAFTTGMAAMAASIMLAFLFTPQYSSFSGTTQVAASSESSMSADVSDLILLDSLGA